MDSQLTLIDNNVGLAIEPKEAIKQASLAAKALQDVIEQRPEKVVINGKTYLTLEDWQLIGHFYGMAARVTSTNYVEFPDPEYGSVRGYEAKAEVIRLKDGLVIGSGESMCMNDEKKWSNKPMHALRSMAQTRACAKSLRNMLAFVPVLAGYGATPAEELTSIEKA